MWAGAFGKKITPDNGFFVDPASSVAISAERGAGALAVGNDFAAWSKRLGIPVRLEKQSFYGAAVLRLLCQPAICLLSSVLHCMAGSSVGKANAAFTLRWKALHICKTAGYQLCDFSSV